MSTLSPVSFQPHDDPADRHCCYHSTLHERKESLGWVSQKRVLRQVVYLEVIPRDTSGEDRWAGRQPFTSVKAPARAGGN